LKYKDSGDVKINVNADDTIDEFVSKVIKDYLLFNAFGVEVIFNVFGVPIEYHHIPLHRLRMNKSKTKFWYCEDWLMSRKYITYDRYNAKNNPDSTSKIFYFDGYFPSINTVYPTPEFAGTIKAIVTDVAIKEFNLNNIKNHFSPSTIITFFNGSNVSQKVKEEITSDIDSKFKGENGKKFILNFEHKDGKPADVQQLSANDWDKAYIEVTNRNIDDIIIGHQCQNPSLFGIKTAGQLGSVQELEVSYEIFKNNYVTVKRTEIEGALNYLFTNFEGITGVVHFADKALFSTRLSDATKEKVYTINELRSIEGMEPIANGDRLLSDAPVAVQEVPVQADEDVKKKSGKKLTESDYELIKEFGLSEDEFEIVGDDNLEEEFDAESDIANYLIEKDIKGLTIPEVVDVLKNEGKIATDENELKRVISKLVDSGVASIETDDKGRIAITPLPKPDVPTTDKIFVMYKYIKKPEISGDDLIPTSRRFCVKLINNKRLYSLQEIQQMSAIFGYDIKKFAGGWYFNSETGVTTSSCRHKWQLVKVKKKA
jgi:hypothetical protein